MTEQAQRSVNFPAVESVVGAESDTLDHGVRLPASVTEGSNPSDRDPTACRTMDELRREYNLLIRPNRLRHWRKLFPNVGQLEGFPEFGNVMILATDGIEAYYHVDFSGQLFKGHLRAFNGPIAKEYVHEDDWDFVGRKRKVRVFRRADGSIVVIPRDTQLEAYWSKHQRLSKEELQVLESLNPPFMTIADITVALEQLQQRVSCAQVTRAPRAKSKQQKILDLL